MGAESPAFEFDEERITGVKIPATLQEEKKMGLGSRYVRKLA